MDRTQLVGKGTEEIREGLIRARSSPCSSSASTRSATSRTPSAWKTALAAADHLVAFSTFENATTAMADVVFPLETHAEKDGTVTHPDGRLQRVRPSAARPGDIRPNWGVLAELSLALGHDTGITSQPSAFAALADAVPFYAGITDAEIGGRGVRWQDRPAAARRRPEARRGADGTALARNARLPRESGPRIASELRTAPSRSGPTATSGPGPITELNPPLRFLAPQQRVEMSVGRRRAARAQSWRRGQGRAERDQRPGRGRHQGTGRRRRLLPDRGHQGRQRQRAAQRRPGRA